MKKIIALVLVALAVTAVFAGCGNSKDEGKKVDLAAVKSNWKALSFVPDRWRYDSEILLEAIKQSGEVVGNLHEHASIGGLTVAALGGDSQTTLTEQVLGLIEVAFSLGECLLDVGKTCTGNGAQLLDVFHIWFVSHNSMKIKY